MASPPAQIRDTPVGEALELISDKTSGPGAGTAAAVSCALAASLVEMAAHYDDSILAQARLTRANALRGRALEVADVERGAYEPVLAAQSMPVDHPQRETRLAAALAAAATPPLTIARIGAQVGGLAAESASQGNPNLIGEAVVAAELADAATRAAAHLVRLNLADSPGDPRRTEVTGLVNGAAEALEEAFAVAAEPQGSSA